MKFSSFVAVSLCCLVVSSLHAGLPEGNDEELDVTPTPSPETPAPEMTATPVGQAEPGSAAAQSASSAYSCPAVGNPVARATSATTVKMTWVDLSSSEESYQVNLYDAQNYQPSYLVTLPANSNNTTLSGYDPSRKQDVNIKTFHPYCELNRSVTLGIPQAPVNLTLAPNNATSIKLTWVDRSKAETTFRIERRVNGGAWSTLLDVGTDVVTTKANMACGSNTYRVRSGTVSTSSWYTNEVTVVRTC